MMSKVLLPNPGTLRLYGVFARYFLLVISCVVTKETSSRIDIDVMIVSKYGIEKSSLAVYKVEGCRIFPTFGVLIC